MTLLHRGYIGILLGRFPGRYTRPKTGIFSWSQYELSHLQNFVLRHIGGIAPRLSRDCPISRRPLTFTHGEISQNFFSQNFRKSPRTHPQNSHRLAGIRRTPQNPDYVTSRRNFSKFFFQNFSQNFRVHGRMRRKCALCWIARNFSQKFFPKFFGILYKVSTPRQLDCEDFVSLQFHYEVTLRSKRI